MMIAIGSRFEQVLEFLFGLSAARHVARHLAEADQLAAGAVNRGDDHFRPELRSIFAYAPAGVLKPAFGDCRYQFLLRLSLRNILLRIKT